MAIDTSKCEITAKTEDGILVRVARGRLAYPSLFTPNKDDKYSTSHVFPKTADLSALKEAIELAAALFFGPDYAKKYPKLKRPILNTAESPAMGADAEAFPAFIRTSTKAEGGQRSAPEVVDHRMARVTDISEVYPGRWAMLTVKVKGYDVDGNKGVTCYLNNVQILEHGDKFTGGGRSASDDFEAVPITASADAMFQ